jgi:hypothetical protein
MRKRLPQYMIDLSLERLYKRNPLILSTLTEAQLRTLTETQLRHLSETRPAWPWALYYDDLKFYRSLLVFLVPCGTIDPIDMPPFPDPENYKG